MPAPDFSDLWVHEVVECKKILGKPAFFQQIPVSDVNPDNSNIYVSDEVMEFTAYRIRFGGLCEHPFEDAWVDECTLVRLLLSKSHWKATTQNSDTVFILWNKCRTTLEWQIAAKCPGPFQNYYMPLPPVIHLSHEQLMRRSRMRVIGKRYHATVPIGTFMEKLHCAPVLWIDPDTFDPELTALLPKPPLAARLAAASKQIARICREEQSAKNIPGDASSTRHAWQQISDIIREEQVLNMPNEDLYNIDDPMLVAEQISVARSHYPALLPAIPVSPCLDVENPAKKGSKRVYTIQDSGDEDDEELELASKRSKKNKKKKKPVPEDSSDDDEYGSEVDNFGDAYDLPHDYQDSADAGTGNGQNMSAENHNEKDVLGERKGVHPRWLIHCKLTSICDVLYKHNFTGNSSVVVCKLSYGCVIGLYLTILQVSKPAPDSTDIPDRNWPVPVTVKETDNVDIVNDGKMALTLLEFDDGGIE